MDAAEVSAYEDSPSLIVFVLSLFMGEIVNRHANGLGPNGTFVVQFRTMLVDTVEVRKKIEGRIALHEAALAKHRARLAAILALEESDDFETEESDIKPRIPGVSPREPESKRGMSKDILRTVRSANAMTMEALFAAIKERYPETSRQAVATSCRRWEERGYLVVAGDRTTGLSVRMNPAAPKEP